MIQESYKDTYFELMQQYWRRSDEQKKRWQVPLKDILATNNRKKTESQLIRLSIDKKDILKEDYISKLQNPASQEKTLSDLANSYSGFHQFNDKATRRFFNETLGEQTQGSESAKTRHIAATETGCNSWFAGNGVTERDNRFLSKFASDLVPDKKYGAVEVLSIFRATKPELLDQEAPKLDALREKNALVTLPLTPIEGLK